ncbi:hypothetical protein L2E82_05131 [Cichorium intybus]|uniref:Uncharacterized protein n=1 Tax=Cichorium intybus TaxID=13427 RepID=A0ACB9H667_CICIN|nr:hypothetical protein L2E82_05131 [Cichorium intybus]
MAKTNTMRIMGLEVSVAGLETDIAKIREEVELLGRRMLYNLGRSCRQSCDSSTRNKSNNDEEEPNIELEFRMFKGNPKADKGKGAARPAMWDPQERRPRGRQGNLKD